MNVTAPEGSEILAKFILLRWDELDELAVRICQTIGTSSSVDIASMQRALELVQDGRWRTLGEYLKFHEDQKYQRRDYGKVNLWRIAPPVDRELGLNFIERHGDIYLAVAAEDVSEVGLLNIKVTRSGVGTLSLAQE